MRPFFFFHFLIISMPAVLGVNFYYKNIIFFKGFFVLNLVFLFFGISFYCLHYGSALTLAGELFIHNVLMDFSSLFGSPLVQNVTLLCALFSSIYWLFSW